MVGQGLQQKMLLSSLERKQPLQGLEIGNAPQKIKPTQKQEALISAPTNGAWTKHIDYSPETKDLVIEFNDGFVATYPNIDKATALEATRGTKSKTGSPADPNSVGAWLHKNPKIMRNYK